MAEIQVIGGGFSGLAVSYFLACRGHQVRLVEKSNRIGGLIDTLQTPYGPVETAANAVIANATVEAVARDLGLELVSAQRQSRRRYIYRDGRLRRWPLRLAATMRLMGLALPAGLRLALPAPLKERLKQPLARVPQLAPRAGENVLLWGHRALGAEATRYLLCPALSGVYAGDPAELSASLTVGKFFGVRRKERPPRGQLRGSVAPKLGMGAWAPAFRHTIVANGGRIVANPEQGLPTVVALPPPAAAAFLSERAPALTAELRKISMVSLLSVTAFFAPETAPIPGFGCLFPRGQGFRARGVLANEQIFPGRAVDSIAETWIFGGREDPSIFDLTDAQLLELVQSERAKLHGLRARMLLARVNRWPGAIPHYDLALENALENLQALGFREGLYRVFGTYCGDLGLGQVLYRASELAKEYS